MIATIFLLGAGMAPMAVVRENQVAEDTEFWELIARSGPGGDTEQQLERLRFLLSGLDPAELKTFETSCRRQLARSYDWGLWGAAYVIHGGASDDGFNYFQQWLILQGSATFETALADPDALAGLIPADIEQPLEVEGLCYSANEAWSEKTGKPAEEMPLGEVAVSSNPLGQPWDETEASLSARFPRLWERFGTSPLG